MEFVIVAYSTKRSVRVDGEVTGSTDEVLQMDSGTHEFDLGEPPDYKPDSLEIVVEGTSVLAPMRLAFAKK